MKFLPTLGGQMSGSLGGLTASHNRGGQYLRRRVTPVNPSTARQEAVRVAMSTLNQAWGQLTPAQRDGWTLYGDNVPTTDVLGQALVLTGQQQYLRSNIPRIQAGLAVVDDPPIIFDTGEPPVTMADLDFVTSMPPALTLDAATGINTSDGASLLFYLGRPQGVGRGFYKGPYQLAHVSTINSGTTDLSINVNAESLTTEYTPNVGQEGLFFPVRLRLTYDDGRLSTPLAALMELLVTAPP